jgi:hypothetical protein
MKRSIAVFAMTMTAVLTAVGLQAVPAYAYPVTPFFEAPIQGHGKTKGSFTWYNRSVGVQGYVEDDTSTGHTTVQFWFWAGNTQLYPDPNNKVPTTRTDPAGGTSKSFNFTVEGPAGGVTVVDVQVCTTDPILPGGCSLIDPYFRAS